MGISAAPGMTSEEIVALSREHTFFSWSVQSALDPDRDRPCRGRLPVHARGQADPRLQQPADVGQHRPRRPARRSTRSPSRRRSSSTSSRRSRPRSGRGSARSWPRSCPATWTRCSSPSAAPRRSRTRSSSPATHTGRYKVLARYRAYHGATFGAMTLTGDPRRWANEPGLVGVVRYPDTHRWGEAEPRPVDESLQGLEDVIRYEGAHTIAAIFLETIVGHERHPHPARRLPQGRPRDLRPLRHPDGRATRSWPASAGPAAGSPSITGTSCRTS